MRSISRTELPLLTAEVDGLSAIADTGGDVDLEEGDPGPAEAHSVLVLHDLMGFTHSGIAAEMSIAEAPWDGQLFLARRAIRRHLAGPDDREERHDR